jgi:putative spermidine/putrescine transport system substrate-binding protein
MGEFMAYDNDGGEQACVRMRELLKETRHLDRRGFMGAFGRVMAGSALASVFAGAMPRLAHAADPVTIMSFGGAYKSAMVEAFCKPFTAKTDAPVQYQEPYNFAKIRTMHQAKAQQIDATLAVTDQVLFVVESKMATPIDWNVVDRSALSAVQLSFPNLVGFVVQSNLLCYSKKKWPGAEHPNSWADFWNVEKFPGRRALRRTQPLQMIEAALLADGVKESEFYPVDMDRAFRKLDQIKPHIKTWWSDNSLSQQMMEQDEVDIIYMANGRASQSIIEHKAPFQIIWNQAITEDGRYQGWFVPVGSPNPTGGMKFLDIVGRAETQAVFARMIYYAPQNEKAYDLLPPDVLKELPLAPANKKIAHIMNYEWWSKNSVVAQRRFEAWLQR